MLFINKLFNSIACLLYFINLQLVIPGRTWILLYLGRTVYKRLWACLALYQCSLTVNECDWHILVGNDERINSHCGWVPSTYLPSTCMSPSTYPYLLPAFPYYLPLPTYSYLPTPTYPNPKNGPKQAVCILPECILASICLFIVCLFFQET